MQMLLPDASFRSPTAIAGKSDMRDENVYSACALSHAATGNTNVFTVPRGQGIPLLGNSTGVAAHQKTYTELTTNISQAGQLGAAIGDASIRKIGISIEQGYYTLGTLAAYGAGPQELMEILGKTFFQLRIAGKLQIQGPTQFFPASGGAMAAFGGVTTAAQTALPGTGLNGWPGQLRGLKLPILVGRTDTIEGAFGVAGGSSLVFSVTTGAMQSTLVWFNLHCLVKGDAR